MKMVEIIYLVFFFLTTAGLLALLFTRQLIYAAFLLFGILLGIAAIYVFAGADFLAVSQLVVYVGGILVLLIFGIMLTQKDLHKQIELDRLNIWISIVLGMLSLSGLLFILNRFTANLPSWMRESSEVETGFNSVEIIGSQNLGTYLFPSNLVPSSFWSV
jgi:NADH-quinone oxidoreductase subunit J